MASVENQLKDSQEENQSQEESQQAETKSTSQKKSKAAKKATKPKFPCGTCSKTTSGCKAILCNLCEFWHHKECIPGMSDEGFQLLLSMKDSMGYTFFLCAKCEKVHKKTWQSVNLLTKRMNAVEERLDKVEKQLKANVEKQNETTLKVKAAVEKSALNTDTVRNSVINEIQAQENKKSNIVIYNLEESSSDDLDSRKAHDTSMLGNIMTVLELGDSQNDIALTRRLGKKSAEIPNSDNPSESTCSEPQSTTSSTKCTSSQRCRPLLVSFKSIDFRTTVLKATRNLSTSQFKHVSLRPDLTKTQQKEDKDLREEVKRLNLDEPLDDNGPFLWKVVGTPGQPNRRKVKIYQDQEESRK